MKKAYVKPEMFYENFELSHNIASCNLNPDLEKPNHTNPSNCTFDGGLDIYFNDSNTACVEKIGTDSHTGEFCYQTGVDDYNVFSS